MENINIEKRKLDYILSLAHKNMSEVDERFKKIDEKISKIGIGSIVYELADMGPLEVEYFPKEIIMIVDKELGIVETYEKSINEYKIESIYNLYLEME